MDKIDSLYIRLAEFKKAEDKNTLFEWFYIKFTPLLEKYAFMLGDKDLKFFLAEALYNALLKIPLVERFHEDKYIIQYIQRSIKNEYIKLSIEQKKHKNYLCSEYIKDDNAEHRSTSLLFWDDLKSVLSKTEYIFIVLKYSKGYTNAEIGRIYGKSRQAISARINRSLEKIKDALF